MNSFSRSAGELVKQNEFITIDGVPFVRDAARVFKLEQTPDEQSVILKALKRIKLDAVVHPVPDQSDVLTVQDVRFGRAVVRYSQHQNDFCVLCFEVLTTFPKEKGLHVLSTRQVRIRDGTYGPVRSWFKRRRYRSLFIELQTLLATTSIRTLDPKRTNKMARTIKIFTPFKSDFIFVCKEQARTMAKDTLVDGGVIYCGQGAHFGLRNTKRTSSQASIQDNGVRGDGGFARVAYGGGIVSAASGSATKTWIDAGGSQSNADLGFGEIGLPVGQAASLLRSAGGQDAGKINA